MKINFQLKCSEVYLYMITTESWQMIAVLATKITTQTS